MAYTVTAPLVIAKSSEGADLYLYESAAVPDGQSQDWIDRHLADGMIAEGEPGEPDKPARRGRTAPDDE